MVSISALRVSFIVLQVCSTILITLLLGTQYFYQIKRHPVISALLVSDILRSLLGALPGVLWRSLGRHVTGFVNGNVLATMCGIDGLLYGYFLGVRIAFNVSISLCIFLMVRRAESPEEVSSEIPRHVSIILAVAPYIWALPLLLIPIPTLVRTDGLRPPAVFNNFFCIILSYRPLVVTGYLVWIPLGSALILSTAILFLILRFYHRHHNVLLSRRIPDYSVIIRLGAMAGLLTTTAVFYSFTNTPPSKYQRIKFVRNSIYWQAVSTFLEFFILTQAQVAYIWKGWAYKLVGSTIPTASSPPSTDPQYSIHPPPSSTLGTFPPDVSPYKRSRMPLFDSTHRLVHKNEIHRTSTTPSGSRYNAGKIVRGMREPPQMHDSYDLQRVVVPRIFPSIDHEQLKNMVTRTGAAEFGGDSRTSTMTARPGLVLPLVPPPSHRCP